MISFDSSKTDVLPKDASEPSSSLPSLQPILGYLTQKHTLGGQSGVEDKRSATEACLSSSSLTFQAL